MKSHHMAKRVLTTACMVLLTIMVAWAQGPNNTGTYYQAADGKTGSALKTAMYGIINGKYKGTKFQQIAYGSGYLSGVWGAFQTTDVLDNGTTIRDRYSNITAYTVGDDQGSSNSTEGKGGYNREHSFPKSWFGGSTAAGPGTDLYHIYPTDVTVNNQRGDLPYGENNGELWQSAGGYSKVGNCTFSGYTKKCFEPDDEWKGDFARSYFYMVTCYQSSQSSWKSDMLICNTYPSFTTWALNLLLKWSRQDPVSDIEIARNEAVCNIQHNRNPFIDYPGLEEYVWGTKTDIVFDYTNNGSSTIMVETPTFSLAEGTYTTEQNVTLACATNGAAIYYTTDGTTPSASSTLYQGAITISTTTTLKAIAIKDGISSEVAEAVYTINSGGNTPSSGLFELVTNTTELESGKHYIIVSGNKALTKFDGTSGTGNVKINSSQIDMNDAENEALILTFEQLGNYWTIKGDKAYMALTSNDNALNSATNATNNKAKWSISVTSSGTATIQNANYTSRYLKYNSSSDMFRCYTSGLNDIQIFKEKEILLGDADNNGQVNVTDVTALVNIVLGKDNNEPYVYNHDAADVNEDGEVNITDVTELVNMILKNK